METTNKKNGQHFLTLPEVQALLGVRSRKTVLKYIRSGKLRAYKLGGTRWRITLDAVNEFLKHDQVHNGHHATVV
jgi:excisionase family DNA binding protein